MDEEIFAAIVRGNEPETLAAIEPLHSPALLLANNNSSSSSRSCCCCCCIFGHPPTAMDKNLHGRKKSLSTRPPAPVPSTKSQLRYFCSSGHYLFQKFSLTLYCSDFVRTPNCFSEFEKTDTAAERSGTEREEQMRMGVVGRRQETEEERDKREREMMGRAGGISKGAKALRLTHCVCGATKVMAAAAAAAG